SRAPRTWFRTCRRSAYASSHRRSRPARHGYAAAGRGIQESEVEPWAQFKTDKAVLSIVSRRIREFQRATGRVNRVTARARQIHYLGGQEAGSFLAESPEPGARRPHACRRNENHVSA